MGRDPYFTDEFPSVDIDGMKYRYGREDEFGQYLVEHCENGKDYWCFNTKEEMLAFLWGLPETAEFHLMRRLYPDWTEVSYEQQKEYYREYQARLFLRWMNAEDSGPFSCRRSCS